MNDSWTERLSEYLDGELATEEKTLCEAHIATCDACRAALDDLRDVVTRARALPEIMPAQDLWPGVQARIAAFAQEAAAAEGPHTARAFTVPASRGSVRRAPARSFSFTWPQLAAAGLALVALSSGISWFASNRATTQALIAQTGSSTTARGPRTSSGAPAGEPTTVSRASTQPDAEQRKYDATVADLQKVLEQRRDELDPQTVATIEANLKIIDLATTQARKALDDDPKNAYLKDHLSKTMQRKVDLLREATQLASATPGNGQ